MEILFIVAIGLLSLIAALFIGIVMQSSKGEVEKGNQSEIKRLQAKIVHDISADFESIGWSNWDTSVHWADGQMERMERAARSRTMIIVPENVKQGEVDVIGESGQLYHVSRNGCTCRDFCTRHLPCKHMYFVAMEQGTRLP